MNTIRSFLVNVYKDKAWFYAKFSFIIIFSTTLIIFAYPLSKALYPIGICEFINLDWLFSKYGKATLIAILAIASIFYVLETKMVFTTCILFLISFIVISFHESNGIFARATILTTIMGVQFFAYITKQLDRKFDLEKYRYQYTIQMLAAAYILAGISKIATSGLQWFQSTEGFVLQITKNYYFLYSDTGNFEWLNKAHNVSNLFFYYPALPKSMLLISLALELLCFVVLVNRKLMLFWGTCLVLMHIGISGLMGIGISVIAFPMLIFFINPLFIFHKLVMRLKWLH